MHIPKTAGHTFNSFLEKAFNKNIYYHYDDNRCENYSVDVIHGHFIADTYKIKGAKKITWLRNPVYQYLSIFAHCIDKFKMPYNYTIKDLDKFMVMNEADFRNTTTKYFNGCDDFDFIGVVEDYNTSLKRLCKLIDKPKYPVELRNTNKNKKYRKFLAQNINKIYNEVKKYNNKDTELYEQVTGCSL